MRPLIKLILVSTVLAASIASASDTRLVTTAKDASGKPAAFTKTAIIVASPDADLRRRAEGGLARRLPNAVAVTTMLPGADLSNREGVKASLKQNGVDGVVLVRPLGVDESVNMEASEQYVVEYPSLWSYWDSQFMVVTRPGYVSIEKVVTVEIVVYALGDERLVWAGRLTATNPKSLRVFLDEMVEKGSKELRKQKLL